MHIISFAWTTPALLGGAKTVTRRSWKTKHAESFHADALVAAYDKSQRCHGQQVATIRITRQPYREHVGDMPDDDYRREGFEYLYQHSSALEEFSPGAFAQWRLQDDILWVVRFELIDITAYGSEVMLQWLTHTASDQTRPMLTPGTTPTPS